MKRLLPFLLIPVFYMMGPNAVGFSYIVTTDMDDVNIQPRDVVACNVVTEYGVHRLIEGVIFNKKPLVLLVDTSFFPNLPLMLKDTDIEFCLMSNQPGGGF